MKVRAFLTASVDDGPWHMVALEADTDAPIMRLVLGDPCDPVIDCSTPDPDLRRHVEDVFTAISDHATQPSLVPR